MDRLINEFILPFPNARKNFHFTFPLENFKIYTHCMCWTMHERPALFKTITDAKKKKKNRKIEKLFQTEGGYRDRTTKCTARVHQVSSWLDSGIQSLLDIDRSAVYSYLSDIYMWEIRRPTVNAIIDWQLGNLSKRNIGIF